MDWHRNSGLLLTDYFANAPFVIELEKDLSLMKQFLDVVIVRKGKGRFEGRLPDGLEDLAAHNLITFKSHQETLDGWALKELIGHYVNYRKQVSPAREPLLPEDQFRLYAVCSHYPHNLANHVPLPPVQPGVHDCRWGTDVIRVVVTRQLPKEEHNAPLLLFSGSAELVRFGQEHYRRRSDDISSLLDLLIKGYQQEGVAVPYTMEDFRRDYAKEHFKDLTTEERREVLQNLPAEQLREVLQGLPMEQRLEALKSLPVEQLREVLQGLPMEQRLETLKSLPVEQLLENLPLEEIEDYLKRRKDASSSSAEKKKSTRKARRRKD